MSPGMQTYNIPSKAIEGARWNLGLKLDNQGALSVKNAWVPGAGTYNPDYRVGIKKLPHYSLKGRHSMTDKKMNNPGPGTYQASL